MVARADQSTCPSGFVQHRVSNHSPESYRYIDKECDAHATAKERSGGDRACHTPVPIPSDMSQEFENLSVGCAEHSLDLIWLRSRNTAMQKTVTPLASGSYGINVDSLGQPGVWIRAEVTQDSKKCHWISLQGDDQEGRKSFSVWIDRNPLEATIEQLKMRFPDTDPSVTGSKFRPVNAVVTSADRSTMQLSPERLEGADISGKEVTWYTRTPTLNPTWYQAPSHHNAETAFDLDPR